MYVAFLRGISVAGKNKIEMNVLKSMFESLGLTNISTYLNTGNVVFDSKKVITEADLEDKINSTFDLDIKVLIRTSEEVLKLIEAYDLDEGPKNCYITMFKSSIDQSLEEAILKVKLDDDKYRLLEQSLLLFVPNGYGKTKLTNNYFEKKSGASATTRNLKTMTKISGLL